MKKLVSLFILLALSYVLSGCAAAMLGGAAAGYMARDKGYKLQPPLIKKGSGAEDRN